MDTRLIVIVLGAMIVRMGLAIHHAGVVRAKNAAGMALRGVAEICATLLLFWLVGAALSQGASHAIFSIDASLLAASPGAQALPPILPLMASVLIPAAVVGGALAERTRFFPAMIISAFVGGIVVPVGAQWAWNAGSFLVTRGFADTAGASVFHWTAGLAAATAAAFVGPRSGKYNRDGSCNGIPGHSVPLATFGTLLMFVGWVPWLLMRAQLLFEGSAMFNGLLAAAAAGFAALLFGQFRFGKPDVHMVLPGLIGGLVAISAGADTVSARSAALIGLVAGILVPWASLAIDMRWRIDDPCGAIAPHAVGGAWGSVAVALFGPADLMGNISLVAVQVMGLLAMAGLAVVPTLLVLGAMRIIGPLRSKEADEFDGLDLAEHDVGAYPDFQQTTIKSYHLREA